MVIPATASHFTRDYHEKAQSVIFIEDSTPISSLQCRIEIVGVIEFGYIRQKYAGK